MKVLLERGNIKNLIVDWLRAVNDELYRRLLCLYLSELKDWVVRTADKIAIIQLRRPCSQSGEIHATALCAIIHDLPELVWTVDEWSQGLAGQK
jgi:hypothetical protein